MIKMGLASIHSVLVKRMAAVAEEIFEAVKDSIVEYEQEIERLKQENCCLKSTLTHNRNGICAETRHDTQRDGGLQGPLVSELSEIQVLNGRNPLTASHFCCRRMKIVVVQIHSHQLHT
ncbi:uncharacterized protein LOC125256955 isoform X2 [Megalobrama amblycephala]|uniref:uncharacterized protein LOC125256955 isoform X2 n=1 Tax=Megalobrama amblycephala TaxID=75352 RepID=UPI002013E9BB|nr:uncharacterized protein LOC125256955 isoform X2 [Megalobrama amblycephala]